MGKIVVLIPAYKPEEKMLKLLESLRVSLSGSAVENIRGKEDDTETAAEKKTSAGTAEIEGIIIVDDGGQEEYKALFDAAEAMGCRVVHHEVNRGKGAAIRTGIQEAVECFGTDVHVVTADADGQHLPKDILMVARAVLDHNAPGGAERPVLVPDGLVCCRHDLPPLCECCPAVVCHHALIHPAKLRHRPLQGVLDVSL